MRGMGRPSTYTPEIAAKICERIANGETLRAICRDEGMPHWTTVYAWIDADEAFSLRIAHARELGFDAIAEETLAILDEAPERCETQFGDKVDAGHVAWQKNRAEQRLKLLAKWSPKKYGDRTAMELTGANGGPIEITETERAAKLAGLLALAQQRKDAPQDKDASDLV